MVTRLFFFSQATDRDAGNFSAVQYRISSGNDGGFFKIDENTGFITTASNFKGKKGERFTIKVSAYDNHGKAPTNEADGEATAQVVIGQVCYNFFKYYYYFICLFLGFDLVLYDFYKTILRSSDPIANTSCLHRPGGALCLFQNIYYLFILLFCEKTS